MHLPANLAAAAEADPEVAAWSAGLPERIAAAAARWTLGIGAAYEPGGTVSWVAPARTADGADVVLKIGRRHPEAEHEAAGLTAWGGRGTVRLLDSARPDEVTGLLLLERCVPGTTAAGLPPRARDVVVAGVLRQLWIVPSSPHPFRPLADMCAAWSAELDVDEAVRLVGDRTFDALQHMLNCPDRLRADPLGFCARMAGLLELDADRLRQWLLARLVVECRYWPGLAALPRLLV